MQEYYLKVGKAADLKSAKDRALFRFLEILPGAISWGTLIGVILLSWLKPVWIAFFIIFFVLYWLIRTIYFSFHLRSGYKKMRENEKIDWMGKLQNLLDAKRTPRRVAPVTCNLKLKNWKNIYHLIILPMYKEPLEIVRETFQALLKTDYPKNRMIIVLAIEERAGEQAEKMAKKIEKEFGKNFFRFLITCHPHNLPGEIAGKGSNDAWASKKAKEFINNIPIPFENIIVSSFDIDTVVSPKYFSCLTYHYLTSEKPLQSSFQPIPVFLNNIWEAPPVSRIFSFSSTFWQTMCQERPEKLRTFSSHSMSFKTLIDVDFRQTNVISDDSRIFWQCFLKYNGDYRTIPLYYPISMDALVAPTFLKTLKNVYKQQRRWAYGVENLSYLIFGFIKNKKIPFLKKIHVGLIVWEGYWSWATNSFIIFLLGWLPLVLGGREFTQTLLAYNLPVFVRTILTIAMFGLIGSAYLSVLLIPPRPASVRRAKKKYLFLILEWLLIPLVMISFTALPALEAQTRWMLGKYMGFWPTEKSRKKNSQL